MHPFKAVSHQRQNKNDNRNSNKRTNNRNNNNNNSNNQQAKRSNSSHQPSRRETKINYYVYGKGSAMEFYCDKTSKQSVSTISINAASKKEDDTTTTIGYDWDKKTSIQLPRNEMLQIIAVMLGMQDTCEFRQNGTHSSKSYKVEFQESKVFFMIMERGKPIRAVGLTPEDTYQVASLFLKQLKENSPWMSVDEIIQMVEMTIVNMGQAPVREDDDEEFAQPADIEDDSIPDEELLENEPNFNF